MMAATVGITVNTFTIISPAMIEDLGITATQAQLIYPPFDFSQPAAVPSAYAIDALIAQFPTRCLPSGCCLQLPSDTVMEVLQIDTSTETTSPVVLRSRAASMPDTAVFEVFSHPILNAINRLCSMYLCGGDNGKYGPGESLN